LYLKFQSSRGRFFQAQKLFPSNSTPFFCQ
jgi:hypothetical protein